MLAVAHQLVILSIAMPGIGQNVVTCQPNPMSKGARFALIVNFYLS